MSTPTTPDTPTDRSLEELRETIRSTFHRFLGDSQDLSPAINAITAAVLPLLERVRKERDAARASVSDLESDRNIARHRADYLEHRLENADEALKLAMPDYDKENTPVSQAVGRLHEMLNNASSWVAGQGVEIAQLRTRAEAAERELAEARAALACIKDRVQFDGDFSADEIVEYITTRVGKYSQGIDWVREKVIQELQDDLALCRKDKERLDWLAHRCFRHPGPTGTQLVYAVIDSSVWPPVACAPEQKPDMLRAAIDAARNAKGEAT